MSLNHELVLKASTALLKHIEKKKESDEATNLLADETEQVHLIMSVKKLSTKERHKPYRISLRTPMYEETASVCLIVKPTQTEYVEKLMAFGIPQIKEIVTMDQLKKKYKSYESKRQLLAMHDLFLADDRVLASLPELLGVKFFNAKKLPAPVNLMAKDQKKELTKALSCTFYRQTKGTCNAIKVGLTSMAATQLADNIEDVVAAVSQLVPKKWENIQSIGIKTGTSLTLPIYNALPMPPTVITDSSAARTVVDQAKTASGKKTKKSPMSRTAADKAIVAAATATKKNARSKGRGRAAASTKA
ncbi:proteasome-interacting protein cic1 [Kickxella alabastrina]|uniref:Proteasome-interacting protein cic1 n=1 Tax=Kickxella alabastrina TaxID=61397 RepID=A0ACC1IRV2_9FUNG|nr:proteasome-interacting protein cic1 [Kickxella alabastrina]